MAKVGIITRRAMLTGSAGLLAAPAIVRSARGQGLRPVSFTLSWLPEGFFAYVFAAKAKGFWQQRGLDVQIARGYGSNPAAQSIAAGTFDFGVCAAASVMLVAAQGIKLVSLAILDYDPSMGVAVLAKSAITTPRHLEGKNIGQTLASSDAPFFTPFCERNGVDIKQVALLNMDARVRNQALVAGKVDAITGLASSILATLESNGTAIRFMNYNDYKVPLYGDIALLTTPRTAAADPALCQAVTDGLMDGLKYSLTNPDETKRLFLAAVPELMMTKNGSEFARLGMAVQRFNVLASQDPLRNGLGWSDPAKLSATLDDVMRFQAGADAKRPEIADIFTNAFAGKVRIRDAEWQTATEQTEFLNPSLHNKA